MLAGAGQDRCKGGWMSLKTRTDRLLARAMEEEGEAFSRWSQEEATDEQLLALVREALDILRASGIEAADFEALRAMPLEQRQQELDRLDEEHPLETAMAIAEAWLSREGSPETGEKMDGTKVDG